MTWDYEIFLSIWQGQTRNRRNFSRGFKIELSSENNMSELMTRLYVLQALMIFPIYVFICILRL